MGDLDLVTKILMRVAPEAFARLCFGPDVTVTACRSADTEIERLKRVMDKLYELTLAGDPQPRWQHVEVAAQWRANLPFRMLEYWVLSRESLDGPLSSLLICLKPGNKQGPPLDAYEETAPGTQIRHRYTLVCAWNWTVDELLSGDPALIPFVPFAGDATPERVDEALECAQHVEPKPLRGELLAALGVFAQNVFKELDWSARMPREMLMESAIYKMGQADGQRRLVQLQLEKRLGAEAAEFVSQLSECREIEALSLLLVSPISRTELLRELRLLLGDA